MLAVLNVSLSGFSAEIGAALRCDVAAALSGLTGAPAPLRVSVSEIRGLDGAPGPPVPASGPYAFAVGNAENATCPQRCSNVSAYVVSRARNSSASAVFCAPSSGASACCAKTPSGVCFAAGGAACGTGAAPRLDATCAVSAAGDCLPVGGAAGACADFSIVNRSVGLCAAPAAAAAPPDAARNASAVTVQIFVPFNATLGVANASSVIARVAESLAAAAAANASGFPALAAALSANCAAFVGGCAGAAAGYGFAPVSFASAGVAAPPPGGGGAPGPAVDAGLAGGLTVLFAFLAGTGAIVFAFIQARRYARRSAKPRQGMVVDYEDLHKNNYIKSNPGAAAEAASVNAPPPPAAPGSTNQVFLGSVGSFFASPVRKAQSNHLFSSPPSSVNVSSVNAGQRSVVVANPARGIGAGVI